VISSEESLIANSGMDLLFFSGQTFGMTMSWRASFQDFYLFPKTRRFLCCSSFLTTTSSHNSTFLCPNKLIKNIKECNITFNLYRFNKIQKTHGTIFGEAAAIHLLNSTISPIEMFSPLLLFCGSGTQNAITNLNFSPGSLLWIG
jgi:hypothetical protein